MPKLILVKHSLPEIRAGVPPAEWHLNEEGRRRALALARHLKAYQPDMVVASKEPKAKETAEIVSRKLGTPLRFGDDLHEHERRTVGLLSRQELDEAAAFLFERPDEIVFGEETAMQALGRFRTAIDGVLKSYPERNVAVVCHGTVISLFVAECSGVEGPSFWKRLGLPSFVVLSLPERELLEVVETIPTEEAG
jgi:probable phosphoglycerate mutase